jgi:hypothetical protein
MSARPTANAEADKQEVLRLHELWYEANRVQSIELMRQCFVGGDEFHGVNINGYVYNGIEEWANLWSHFLPSVKVVEIADWDVRVTVDGNVGWTTYEGSIKLTFPQPEGAEIAGVVSPAADQAGLFVRWHGTEICRREDEHGNPIWKMWHFHGSPSGPPDVPRP